MSRTGDSNLGLSSKNLFHHKEHRISGLTHGDDFVLTGPAKKLMEFERKLTSVYPIKAKIISYGWPKSIKTLNWRLHWGRREIVYQHDPKHVDVLVKDLGLEDGNSVQTPAAHYVMKEEESEPLSQVQHQQCRHNIHRERIVPEHVESQPTESCQIEMACQVSDT